MGLNYYDHLFHTLFRSRQAAADLARNVLPEVLLRQIDPETAAVEERSFVDRELRSHYSDLLLRFERTGRPGAKLYLYVLIDHKSRPERWAAFQLLRYVGLIYRDLLEERRSPEKLPQIVPVIFYHGPQRWIYPLETSLLIDGEAADESIPRFRPVFYDLGSVEDEEIRGTARTVAGLLALKYIRRRFTEEITKVVAEHMHRVSGDTDLLNSFCVVLNHTKETGEVELFIAKVREMKYTDIEEGVMTFAEAKLEEGKEKGKKEGIREGLQEGIQEGIREGIQEGLQEGLTEGTLQSKREVIKRQVGKKFGLTPEEAAAIDRLTDLAALDAAIDEIIDAAEKRQVMAELGF